MANDQPEGVPPSTPPPGQGSTVSASTSTTASASATFEQDFQAVQEKLKQLVTQASDTGTVPVGLLSEVQSLTAKLATASAEVAASHAGGQLSANPAVAPRALTLTSNALGAGDNGQSASFYQQLQGIPIDYLVTTPLVSAARGNIALATVMTDFVNAIGFNSEGQTNVVQFILDQPYQVSGASTMEYQTATITVTAPLLSLVPLPALLVQDVTVDLTVNISNSVMQGTTSSSSSTAGATASVSGSYWFTNFSFTGSYSNTNSTTSTSNQTASQAAQYQVQVVAQQQPPTAGMLALSQIFANCIVPVQVGGK
jgi:hypothetical protein